MIQASLLLAVLATLGFSSFAFGYIGIQNGHVADSSSYLARKVRDTSELKEPIKDCVCVLYYNCNNNFTLNTHGDMLIDIRVKGPCEHYLEVCCKKKSGHTGTPGESSHGGTGSTGGTENTGGSGSCGGTGNTGGTTGNEGNGGFGGSGSTGGNGGNGGTGSTGGTTGNEGNGGFGGSGNTGGNGGFGGSGNTGGSGGIGSTGSTGGTTGNEGNGGFGGSGSTGGNGGFGGTGSTGGTTSNEGTGGSGGTGNTGGSGGYYEGTGSTGGVGSTMTTVEPYPDPAHSGQDRYKSRGCGFRNEQGVGFRIIGSKNEAQFGEFPWMVALLDHHDKYLCGGSLIHPRVVLTAVHCLRGIAIENVIVRAGEWDRGTNKEVLPHQDRRISEVIEHEHFHSGALLNDVALLILSEKVEIIDNVDIICLPPEDYNFDYAPCVASGWGKGHFDAEKNDQVILKKVQLPVVPKDKCEKALRGTRLGEYFELHESFICAGGQKGQDTCRGDGGSPLMCPVPNAPGRYQQAGIVAWGIGCGDVTPGVYVNIPHFRKWIDENLAERGIFIPIS